MKVKNSFDTCRKIIFHFSFNCAIMFYSENQIREMKEDIIFLLLFYTFGKKQAFSILLRITYTRYNLKASVHFKFAF